MAFQRIPPQDAKEFGSRSKSSVFSLITDFTFLCLDITNRLTFTNNFLGCSALSMGRLENTFSHVYLLP